MNDRLIAENRATDTNSCDKSQAVTIVTDERRKMTYKTASVTIVTMIVKSLINKKNVTNQDVINTIYKLVSDKCVICVTIITDSGFSECYLKSSSSSSLMPKTENTASSDNENEEKNNGVGSCDNGENGNTSRNQQNKEKKIKIVEEVIKEHGKNPTEDNIMRLAIEVHKRMDEYAPYDAAIDIRNKYNLGEKPQKQVNDNNGVLSDIKEQLQQDHSNVDFDVLYDKMRVYRQIGGNGKLKPIAEINEMLSGFVLNDAGKPWHSNPGPVKAMLEIILKHETNGEVTA